MIQEVKQFWTSALTSGEYQQSKHRLRRAGGFCCYGVLCDLHQKVTNEGKWEGSCYQAAGDRSKLAIPDAVARWSGLNADEHNEVKIRGLVMDLAAHNDAGVPFAEIAAAIREQL